jgi:tRNA (mo5U34)-methyltransferase
LTSDERPEVPQMYHQFEFPDGTIVPGFFDLRKTVSRLPIPSSLAGRRCLDVASATGFFAIELARRGGQVVSVDVDDPRRWDWQGPPGVNEERSRGKGLGRHGFEVACDAFGVEIERHDLSLYELSPERLGGTFDYVFMGNILLHLSDPGRGLRAVRSVVAPGGELLSFEGISLPLTVLRPFSPIAELWRNDGPTWWRGNLKGHRRMVEAGGFRVLEASLPFLVPFGDVFPRKPERRPRHLHELAFWLFTRRFGTASAWVRAAPRPLTGAVDEPSLVGEWAIDHSDRAADR